MISFIQSIRIGSCEEELRGWFKLEERDPSTGFYFYPFDDKLKLSEIIAGPFV